MAYIKQINVGGTAYDIKAAADASGNIIADTYVNKSGDTMTGDLHFSATATGSKIVFGNTLLEDTEQYMYSIGHGGHDTAGLDQNNNISLNTWYGFSVTSQCTGIFQNMPTWSVNARNGFTYQWGVLNLQRKTSIANNYAAGINFSVTQTDNNITSTGTFIYAFDDHDAKNYGHNLVIQSAGNLIAGSGESPLAYYNANLTDDAGENLYLVSDRNIYLKPGLNDYPTLNSAYFVKIDPSCSDTVFAVRNISYGTTAITSGGSAGDVYIQYF